MQKLRLMTVSALVIAFIGAIPNPARADAFGGDVAVLLKILADTTQQLVQLRQILGNSQDSLNLARDINSGIREAMDLTQTMNQTLQPGVFSDLGSVSQAMGVVETLYGRVPKTSEAATQKLADQSVAEAFHLHNEAFRYANQIDPEAERIKDYARTVSPQGAGKLTAQSLGVLINVTNQVLRTNAAMVKLQGEQLAMANRRDKLSSEQFRVQYDTMATALTSFKPTYDLPSVSGSN